jgi:hypothetical protein
MLLDTIFKYEWSISIKKRKRDETDLEMEK